MSLVPSLVAVPVEVVGLGIGKQKNRPKLKKNIWRSESFILLFCNGLNKCQIVGLDGPICNSRIITKCIYILDQEGV
ncbi:hypothetical protein PGT21_033577 [Puccinia graminis f. sp. tritici]|uniref:Uncharacterized protein n=1 Tax=Puccinia graminis f. sp. tritici TaxID=56615 RepID=A0A5B0QCC9_PUCGR|nr:hypothetical protein PGT21_033577 [Puccinia graminis f. sp. tritici]